MSSAAVLATKATSATSLTGTPNPATFGQTVTLTARVSGAFGTPTGTVTFDDGTVALGSVTLNASGVATYSTRSLSGSTHTITAAYGGSSVYGTSSGTLSEIVKPVVCSTPLPGTISGNTELKVSTCDAYLSSGTTVEKGATLTLDAGVTVQAVCQCYYRLCARRAWHAAGAGDSQCARHPDQGGQQSQGG